MTVMLRTRCRVAAACAWLLFCAAVQAAAPRVCVLVAEGPDAARTEWMRTALAERGYEDGKTVLLETRQYRSDDEQLRAVVSDVIGSSPDVIVTVGTPGSRAVLAATTTIPVVFLTGDPKLGGLADSLVRPSGNATGISILSLDMTAKRGEYLHALSPRARRLVYLMNPFNPLEPKQLETLTHAAQKWGVKVEAATARSPNELDAVLRRMMRAPPEALLISGNTMFFGHQEKIAKAVRGMRRPAMFPYPEYHEHGAIMSFGPSLRENMRLAASYVDKILKGARPGDLPVEQISKFDLVIDLRAAREMGLEVPAALRVRADRVIE